MSRTIQTLTLGVALGAGALAAGTFAGRAEAERRAPVVDQGIAFVDVFGLVDQIVMGAEPTAARVAFESQTQQQAEALQARNQEIQRIAQANPEDPNLENLGAEFQQNNQLMQNLFQSYQEDLQTLIAGQIAAGYKQVYAAAEAVAAESGIDFVFATRPGSDLLQTDSITGVAQEILARPLIAPAASIDLTAKVRDKLGLPEPTEEDASILEGEVPTPTPDAESAGEPDAPAGEPAPE
jgi:Skp family chaperone for outer membrane proteins